MRRFLGLVIVLALLSFSSVPVLFAEEELFDSKTAKVHLEKGLSYLKARSYHSAVAELEESIVYAPDAESYYYLGYAYYLIGRSGDAESRKKSIECFEKAYELDPGFTPNRFKTEEIPQRMKEKAESLSSAATATTQPQPPSSPSENK